MVRFYAGKTLHIFVEHRLWVAYMAQNLNSRPVITTTSSSYLEYGNSSAEDIPWHDKQSMQNMPKYLIVVEVVSKHFSLSFNYLRYKPDRLFPTEKSMSVYCWAVGRSVKFSVIFPVAPSLEFARAE